VHQRSGDGHPPGWAFLLLSLLVASVAALAVVHLRRQVDATRHAARQQIAAVADLEVERIGRWRGERLIDAAMITATPGGVALVRDVLAHPRSEPLRTQPHRGDMLTRALAACLRGEAGPPDDEAASV
jgi:hypothetical protein